MVVVRRGLLMVVMVLGVVRDDSDNPVCWGRWGGEEVCSVW